jgi:hypothetical protein
MMKHYTKRQELEILRSQLELERSTFLSHWRDLSEHILPRRQRFNNTDVNRGDKRNQKIIDSTATLALRTLRSGMMSGVTSPARPWFRLTVHDQMLAEAGTVKMWLHDVANIMSTAFLRSNLYNVLPTIYGDIGGFGTAAMLMEEDAEEVFRFMSIPIGSYTIANDDKLRVRVFVREFRFTVRQLLQRFGKKKPNGEYDLSNFSTQVKHLYDSKQLEQWIDVVHVIKPNPDFDERKMLSKYKRFMSCYYEKGVSTNGGSYNSGQDENVYLSEKGYDFFPILCPRWETTGEDVYGTSCPGMEALGDIKQLQLGEKRILQAIEKMVTPPMQGPSSLKNTAASFLPGDITYIDALNPDQGLRPIHQVNPNIQDLEFKQNQVRDRIRRAFFEDLFLMLASSDRRQITAREIEERHEEKLLALGPVLEQLNQDLLDPLIDNAFQIMLRQELIPPPPEELQGMPLKVEYISIMHQAQRSLGIAGVERFAGFVTQVAQVNPEALDKIDTDQLIDVYGDLTSVPPSLVRADEAVAELRAGRAQMQQAQQQAMMMKEMATTAKDLSQAKTNEDNALTQMISAASANQLVEGAV